MVNAQAVEIPNANFNSFSYISGSMGKYKPNDWTSGSSYRVYARTDTAVEGEAISISAGNTVSFITTNFVSITSGESYAFCYSAKSDGESGSALLTVYTYDFAYNQISVHTGTQTALNSQTWESVPCEFMAEQNASFIKIEITVNAQEDKCYFDNLTVLEKIITPELTTLKGASLRLVKDSPGIRFRGRVEKTLYDEFNSKYQGVSAGILITLKESLDSVGEFTAKALTNAGKICAEIAAEKWSNLDTASEDGYYEFYCALINVKPQNVNRDMAFITYFTYVKDGVKHIVYGNFNETDNVRSVYTLSNEAYSELDSYSQEQQEIIIGYLSLVNS